MPKYVIGSINKYGETLLRLEKNSNGGEYAVLLFGSMS